MINRVLIISTTGMGDCLWGTPGIRALKKSFPEVEIDLVVNRPWKPLFEHNPYLNEIIEYQDRWYLQPLTGMKLLGRSYDVVFLFHANRNFRRMLPWLRSLPIWTYQNHDWIPESHRVKIGAGAHGIQKMLIMMEKFGVKPDGGQMEIFFDQAAIDKSQQFLESQGLSPGKYVYLNLGAAVESRRWMVERFIELAGRIINATSWNIILGGGPNEKERAVTILNQLNNSRATEVCSLPISLNANIISKAGLMVSSDTGPMHVGFAVRTPVVALFGSIPTTVSGPHEIPDHLCRVITIDPKEKDFVGEENPGEFHLGCITVDMVWNQVERMMEENSNS